MCVQSAWRVLPELQIKDQLCAPSVTMLSSLTQAALARPNEIMVNPHHPALNAFNQRCD